MGAHNGLTVLLRRQSFAFSVDRPFLHHWRLSDALHGADLAEAIATNHEALFLGLCTWLLRF